MEEAQEKDMDSVASFKSGKTLTITGRQYNVCSQNQMINLLASSNRYGYIFYATENDGLIIIPSAYIDQESRYLTKTSEDDDDDNNNENSKLTNNPFLRRSYIPGQLMNKNPSIIPYWIALNADESILSLVLSQLDTNSWIIILYDVVKLIQTPDSTPICPPLRLSSEATGGSILNFSWNPVIPNIFAYLDANGTVTTYEIDPNSKQLKELGKSEVNSDNSSICWSPKGKQLVVVTYDGALQLYEPNMKLKKKYPSATANSPYPPCISVIWISTHQFLLGFSENSPDENDDDNLYFHVLITYDKDQNPVKTQIYNDLFFDTSSASNDINPQYFYVRLHEWKVIISGNSKSLKINMFGSDELNQDSLDIWAFADQFRATVKGLTNVNDERPILTGMAIGLNSTLSITEGNQKLPSCPILLLSNSEGVLQVYYFIHKSLPSLCRSPELIQQIQRSSINDILGKQLSSQPSSVPLGSLQSFITTPSSPSNDLSFTTFGIKPTPTPTPTTTTTITSLPKGATSSNVFNFNQQLTGNKITQQPSQISNGSLVNDLPKSTSINNSNKPTPLQTPTKTTTTTEQSSSSSVTNNKKLLQMVDQFQSKLTSLKKPLPKLSDSTIDLDKSLEHLTTTLNNMTTLLQTSIQSIKSMTSEHIESMTKIEDALHQIKLSQKENLYHLLRDRELDPWTQSRLDLIKIKYDKIKHDLNVLLQLTHTTIHDKSLSINDNDDDDDEKENEDFLPELELSLNTNETMKQRIHKRICELSHKVSETENDLQTICTKLKPLSLNTDSSSNSKTFDSTFTKTTMSSTRSFHASDTQILSHLQATHPNVIEIRVPPAAIINLSAPVEQKKQQSTIETTKPITPSIQPSTPKQANLSSVESESFKNMLRICQTTIDLFSGATSPEQLQELSKTIASSPLSSAQRSSTTPIHKTPTTKKPLNTNNSFPSPAKSIAPSIPIISLTPATPAPQTFSSDATHKNQSNRQPVSQTPTDLSRSQTISTSGDSAIRSLLNNNIPSPSIISISTQPIITSTPSQVIKPTILDNTSSISTVQSPLPVVTTAATPVVSTPASIQSPFGALSPISSTHTTSVQSTSPTTKPVTSSFSAFGSKPSLPGAGLSFAPTTLSSAPFGNTATTTTTTGGSLFGNVAAATTSASSPFGFGAIATTSTASTGPFSTATSPSPSPFGGGGGGGFGAATTTTATTSVPGTGSFGSGFGSTPATTTSAPSSGAFGSGFGSATAATTPATSSGSFGSTFGSTPTATTSATSPSPFGSGFGSSTTAASPFGNSFSTTSSAPGASSFNARPTPTSSAPTGSIFGGFGASSTATASTSNSSSFGSPGFGFTPAMPAVSIATPTPSAPLFGSGGGGGGTSSFGSGFSGFGAQTGSGGSASGFSFGGFGSQPSDTTATQSGFGSFTAPPAAAQPPSPFGGTFGGGGSPAAASPGFGATSSFGASSTQSATSPSFTAYRK